MDKIRVVLPKKYDLVVGDTFQLFYRGVVEAPDPFCYDILAVCQKGKNFPRYFEFCPEEQGEYELTIYVYGADKALLGMGKTLLKVVAPESPSKLLNILCVGDSLTVGGQWPQEAYRRLTSTDGEPQGLGFKHISFVGSCKKDDVCYEGYGGWKWESYMAKSTTAVWIECKLDKTEADQHSIWQDEQGNLWQIETLDEFGFIKFMRYGEHTASIPKSGCLYHYKNAVNKEPIFIKNSFSEKPSPFYDAESGEIDFASYCMRNKIESVDAVYVLLGWNGLHKAKTTLKEHCNVIVDNAKTVVDMIHKEFPHAQIKVMGLQVPSVNGGMGSNYGAVMPYCDDYGMTGYVMDLNEAYEAWTLEDQYCDFMEFINISGQFDTDYNMQCTQKKVNTRSNTTEIFGTNGVHPAYNGYMQIADAAFRNMVHLCKNHK